jgi:hypothetical protein
MSLGNFIALVVFMSMTLIDVQLILANSNTLKMNLLEIIQLVDRNTFNSCKVKHTHK